MIAMYECPHCHRKVIPWYQKLLVGPRRFSLCPACKREFGVSPLTWLNGLLCGLTMIAMVYFSRTEGPLSYPVLLVPYTAMAVVHLAWVDLKKK
jgi:hypothetical protein